jgi:hypothetical protein
MKRFTSVFDPIFIKFFAVAVPMPVLVSIAMAAYTFTDLGEFGCGSYEVSINNVGQVVGNWGSYGFLQHRYAMTSPLTQLFLQNLPHIAP